MNTQQVSLFDWMPPPVVGVAQPEKPARTPAPAPSGRWLFKAGDLITDRTMPDSSFRVLEQLEVMGQKMYRVLWVPGGRETAMRAEVATRWHRSAEPTPETEPQPDPAPVLEGGAFPLRSKVTCRNKAAMVVFSGPALTLVEFSDHRIVWVPHAEVTLLDRPPLTREGMIQEILQLDAQRGPWWARPEAQSARRGWLSELTPEHLLNEHQLYIRTYRGAM